MQSTTYHKFRDQACSSFWSAFKRIEVNFMAYCGKRVRPSLGIWHPKVCGLDFDAGGMLSRVSSLS